MTTETTSPTLHERLREANAAGRKRNRSGTTELWLDIPVADLAAIERDIREETTAPLRQEIEHVRAVHTTLRHTSTIEIDRLRAENAKLGAKVIELRREADDKHAENAALRQAGDALSRAAEMVVGKSTRNPNTIGTMETWFAWRDAYRSAWRDWYDAATTPRAEETDAQEHINSVQAVIDGDVDPSPTDAAGEVTDGPIIVPDRLTVLEDTVAKIHSAYGDRLANLEARATPADQDPALQARPHKERIDDLVTRCDAATEQLDMHMRRIAALEQRVDEDHKVIDVLQVWGVDLQKRLAALEARGTTPQPVAEVSEVTESMLDTFYMHMQWPVGLGDTDQRKRIRAGLTAALAAAKDGGK